MYTVSGKSPFGQASFCAALLSKLYKRSNGHQTSMLDTIIRRNAKLHQNNRSILFFNNELYHLSDIPVTRTSRANTIHRELRADIRKYVATDIKLKREEQTIKSYIAAMLLATRNKSDWEELLPEALHGIIQSDRGASISSSCQMGPFNMSVFKATNGKYLDMMKSRLLYNLIDVG